MYIFLSDETNTTQTAVVLFMIYGAIVMPMENAATAVEQVIAIRQTAAADAPVASTKCRRSARARKFNGSK
jgi:hypothetical protein